MSSDDGRSSEPNAPQPEADKRDDKELQTGSKSADASDDWIPDVGSVVLAKLKGFPQWPAMVVGEDAISEEVRAARPKGRKVWPVMFFNDNTFMWASMNDMKELTPEKAQKYVEADEKKKGKKKGDKGIVGAYRIAADPPAYVDFIYAPPGGGDKKKKSTTSKAKADKAAAGTDAKDKDKDDKPAPKAEKSSKAADKKRDSPTTSNGPPPPPPKKAKTEPEPAAKSKPKPKASTNGAAGPGSASRGSPAPKAIPTAKQLKEDAELKSRLTLQLRHRLQKGFLSNKPDEQSVKVLSQYLTQLEEIPDLELSIIRQTKVNKVLKAILKIDDIPLESEYKFHERSLKLLEQWSHLDESAIAKPIKSNQQPASETPKDESGDAKSEAADKTEAPKTEDDTAESAGPKTDEAENKDKDTANGDVAKSEE